MLIITVVAAAGLSACDGSGAGVDDFSARPCVTPASTIAPAALEGLTSDGIRTAVLDAAGRIAASMPDGADADELRRALATMNDYVAVGSTDTACRLVHIAAQALARLPDDDATLPDRAALSLVIDLVSTALALSFRSSG